MYRRVNLFIAVAVVCGCYTALAVAASSPSVSTGATTRITGSTAVLHGTVDPNGADTGYRFEWGLTSAYGDGSRVVLLRSRTKPASVQATASDLEPGTNYHYRLDALNRAGSVLGADHTFTTAGNPPPIAATGPAGQVGQSTVTLSAVIDPNGVSTEYYFRYGLTSTYSAQTVSGTIAAVRTPVTVAAQLQGLEPGTIFHYQVVAANRDLSTTGADGMFMTLPKPAPAPRVRARTKPARARTRPYTLTTSGLVKGPAWIPSTYACAQTAAITFMLGRRRVASTLAPVQSNCTFSAQTVFARLPGRGRRHRHVTLRVLVRYAGDGYLAAASAKPERVILG